MSVSTTRERFTQPQRADPHDGRRPPTRLPTAWIAIITVAALTVGAVVFLSRTGHWLIAPGIQVDPARVDLGTLNVGDSPQVRFSLTNLTDKPYTVYGFDGVCHCLSKTSFPLAVPARQAEEVRIDIEVPEMPGPFERTIRFVVSPAGRESLVVQVSGAVSESAGFVAAPTEVGASPTDRSSTRKGGAQ